MALGWGLWEAPARFLFLCEFSNLLDAGSQQRKIRLVKKGETWRGLKNYFWAIELGHQDASTRSNKAKV